MANTPNVNAQALRVDATILQFFHDNPKGFIDSFTSDVNERARSGVPFDTAFQTVLDQMRSDLRSKGDRLPPVNSDNITGDLSLIHNQFRDIRDALAGDYHSGARHSAQYYAKIATSPAKVSAAADALAPSGTLGAEAASLKKQNIAELTGKYGADIATAARTMYTSFNNDKAEASALAAAVGQVDPKGSWGEYWHSSGSGMFVSDQQRLTGQVNRAIAATREDLKKSGVEFREQDVSELAYKAIEIARNKEAKSR